VNKDGTQAIHTPVLLQEVLRYLEVDPDGIYIDCTLGDGGYSSAIAGCLDDGQLVSIDVDSEAIAFVRSGYESLLSERNWTLVRENFSRLSEIMKDLQIDHADGIVFDLGMSSRQIDADTKQRGFSYLRSEPLDMRMDERLGISAQDLVKALSEKELTKLFQKYGEERYAKRIARSLKEWVKKHTDDTLTTDTVAVLVRKVVPAGYREGPRHPARRVFQALRVAVNDELRSLQQGLSSALSVVAPGGRVIVLSYHSLEDRIVKDEFAHAVDSGGYKLLSDGPVTPSEEEVAGNPRARSAKMRVIQKRNR
jgi:16S rRNA (cytosine1402-N4)-methyltransferase